MLDATKSEVQRQLLENELESVGIRLNKRRPNLYFKVFFLLFLNLSQKFKIWFFKEKKTGGISFNSTCLLTKCDEKLVQMVLHEYS
jgi:ribosome-interacting GTPase 1